MWRWCRWTHVGNLSLTASQVEILTLRGVTSLHRTLAALSCGWEGYSKCYWDLTMKEAARTTFQITWSLYLKMCAFWLYVGVSLASGDMSGRAGYECKGPIVVMDLRTDPSILIWGHFKETGEGSGKGNIHNSTIFSKLNSQSPSTSNHELKLEGISSSENLWGECKTLLVEFFNSLEKIAQSLEFNGVPKTWRR